MKRPLTPDEEEQQAMIFALIIVGVMAILIISIISKL